MRYVFGSDAFARVLRAMMVWRCGLAVWFDGVGGWVAAFLFLVLECWSAERMVIARGVSFGGRSLLWSVSLTVSVVC